MEHFFHPTAHAIAVGLELGFRSKANSVSRFRTNRRQPFLSVNSS